jgi:hypothetical protein
MAVFGPGRGDRGRLGRARTAPMTNTARRRPVSSRPGLRPPPRHFRAQPWCETAREPSDRPVDRVNRGSGTRLAMDGGAIFMRPCIISSAIRRTEQTGGMQLTAPRMAYMATWRGGAAMATGSGRGAALTSERRGPSPAHATLTKYRTKNMYLRYLRYTSCHLSTTLPQG